MEAEGGVSRKIGSNGKYVNKEAQHTFDFRHIAVGDICAGDDLRLTGVVPEQRLKCTH